MKRILLIATLGFLTYGQSSAQTNIINLDFDQASDFDDMYTLDADGDGIVWGITEESVPNSELLNIHGGFAYSASYDENAEDPALTPDNLLFLPVVSIPEGATNVEAKVKIGALDFTFFAEHFAIYAIPGDAATTELIQNIVDDYNEVSEIVAILGEPLYEETLAEPEGSFRTMDLSAYQGQSVRLVVRHFDCTNEYFIAMDGYRVDADILGVSDYASSLVKVYPNPAKDILNVSLTDATASEARIYDLNGRLVLSRQLTGTDTAIDLSTLSTGMYALELITNQGKAVKKIVKN
ncbi:T9SS type A sorting domain-containing protein [Flavobacterium silvaticum]|uniref:T9SS type A sorting domain-containing protein n=1 Tax=Flavobacterium silvaticum TaxID=1852020 RepID=A0A972JJ61_9FLAO|nr:T9SS type A sorting domain-containing protein [Flavobacterium silvaticum]NMH29023.1 T9SS type A sorting domain-containing protein [Flavobacterium silvaticum]